MHFACSNYFWLRLAYDEFDWFALSTSMEVMWHLAPWTEQSRRAFSVQSHEIRTSPLELRACARERLLCKHVRKVETLPESAFEQSIQSTVECRTGRATTKHFLNRFFSSIWWLITKKRTEWWQKNQTRSYINTAERFLLRRRHRLSSSDLRSFDSTCR